MDQEPLLRALQIIGEAISIDPDDLQDDDTWTYLGLGDLLAKATVSDLKAHLDFDVPEDLFARYATVAALKTYLLRDPGNNSPKGGHPDEPADPWQGIPKPKVPLSVVLQGNPSTSSSTVFLFPDGSGAGTSYATLPSIAKDVCLIGLNSPFLRQAQDFTCSIERMARLWFDEVKKLQPQNRSFTLGGWSAGGYYAYEVAKLLNADGKTIERIILIDSPCRLIYEALPDQVVAELTRKGLMGASGAKKAPEWLVQHFTSTVLSVDKYMPIAMDKRDVPAKVNFVWAREGLVDDVAKSGLDVDLNVKVTRFLLEPRGELKTEGWERLLPGAEYSFDYMTGNHFQITQPPHSDNLGQVLQKLLCT